MSTKTFLENLYKSIIDLGVPFFELLTHNMYTNILYMYQCLRVVSFHGQLVIHESNFGVFGLHQLESRILVNIYVKQDDGKSLTLPATAAEVVLALVATPLRLSIHTLWCQ